MIKKTLDDIAKAKGKDNLDAINVRSSPFVRCLQTGAQICRVLESDITADYTYCERMGDDLFKENPVDSLEINLLAT